MAIKLFAFLAIAGLVSQGYGAVIEDIRLDDEEVNHIANPLFSRAIGIPHLMLDKLESCSIVFPNGMSYNVFPTSTLPSTVSALGGVFPSCAVSFNNPAESMSGTYELTALT